MLRINTDGTIPKDNPFLADKAADPSVYAAWLPRSRRAWRGIPLTGELWTTENEPRGGDELNVIRAGKNYGFPVISYGRDNNGKLLNNGKTQNAGMEQPDLLLDPLDRAFRHGVLHRQAIPRMEG